jgi:hypothetical protein
VTIQGFEPHIPHYASYSQARDESFCFQRLTAQSSQPQQPSSAAVPLYLRSNLIQDAGRSVALTTLQLSSGRSPLSLKKAEEDSSLYKCTSGRLSRSSWEHFNTPARWQAQKISASSANLPMASAQIRTLTDTNATVPRHWKYYASRTRVQELSVSSALSLDRYPISCASNSSLPRHVSSLRDPRVSQPISLL